MYKISKHLRANIHQKTQNRSLAVLINRNQYL